MTNKTYDIPHLDRLTTYYNTCGWQRCDRGTLAALRAYIQTNDLGLDILAVRDMPATTDMPDFVGILAETGITEFLLCDQSSGLMDALHYLLADGWQVCGSSESTDEKAPLLGLLMRKGEE